MKFILLLFIIGYSSGSFDKRSPKSEEQCPIKLYNPQDSSFTGVKLYANVDTFHPLLKILSTYAKDCEVKINVKQGFIQGNGIIQKTITDEHTLLAFQLGEAIEFELFDQNNHILCEQSCMKRNFPRITGPPDVRCFLRKISQNQQLKQDNNKPSILLKQMLINESIPKLNEKIKHLQNNCKTLKMN